MFTLTACGSIKELISSKSTASVSVGDIIEFGAYEQDNDTSNGKEPIEWQVLAKEGDKVLVISKYALDTQLYNTEYGDITWETCTLRTWLNVTFLEEAFNEAEQSMIQTTEVSADENPDYCTGPVCPDPGNATKDKIFLLSINEANKYFASDKARMCAPTAYAIANGAYAYDNDKVDGAATCLWWLRSPGYRQHIAARVGRVGGVYSGGGESFCLYSYYYDDTGVRPAMWIDLEGNFSSIKIMEVTEAAQNDDNIIEFGAYEQDNDTSNGKEPIEWLVLERDGNKILVISKYALDTQPYNTTEWEEATWETCTLRTWLNETFINEAFSEAEQSMIQTTEVTAQYGIDQGNDTNDKVFLLSTYEVDEYFASNEARMCVPTAYAIANGAGTDVMYKVDGEATCIWRLRSAGNQQLNSAVVDCGNILRGGLSNVADIYCVRPAMWIDLDA